MGIGDILGLAFVVFLWLGPPTFLIYQVRSAMVRWGRGFGFPQASRRENPGMFWTLIAFEAITMLAADVATLPYEASVRPRTVVEPQHS